MKQRFTAIALVFLSLACAGGGAPGSPAPDTPLAYGMPPITPLVYTVADTVSIDMDIAGTPVQVGVRAEASMEAGFTQAGGALNAVLRYTAMKGAFTNSMGPAMPISNDDIPEPATVRLEPDGAVSVVDLPPASEAFRQIFGAESAYRRLFVRLPGRAVAPGTMWTDTVSLTEDIGSMTSESVQVITTTLVGDTIVNGRTVQRLESDISGTTRISGINQGMEIRQYMNGTGSAVTLWDPARRAVIDRVETGTAQGSMEMPGMGMTGLPVRMTSKSVIRLQVN